MYLILVSAILSWLFIVAGFVVILGGFALLVAAPVSLGFILARRRATRQDSLLWILSIAAEKGIPFAPAVLAFADQYRGGSRRRITNLAARLNAGTPLPVALEQERKLVSRDAVLLCGVGQITGLMPRALRMAATTRSSQFPIWAAIAARIAYLMVLLVTMETIASFLFYFIVPKFEAIFSDFGIRLPRTTVISIEVSHFLIKYFPLTALLFLGQVILLFFLPMSFISWGNFDVPLFDRLLGRRHTCLVLRALSLFVDAGKPISLGLSTLSRHYPTWRIRRRLANADEQVAHGADWIEAMRHQQLIRESDAEVLQAATATGNLGWALGELADSGERRLAIRFQAVIQTLFPVLLFVLGVVVFWLALTYFSPLVTLIMRISDRN
jgi:type II secretory pathway component PulF